MRKTEYLYVLGAVALLAVFPMSVSGEEVEEPSAPAATDSVPSCQQLATQEGDPVDIEPVACSGACEGIASGFGISGTACNQLTQEQKDDLMDDACADADKPTARRRANDVCLARDNSGNCLCTGGSFTEHRGAFTGLGGGCIASCKVKYKGTCSTVRAPGELAWS